MRFAFVVGFLLWGTSLMAAESYSRTDLLIEPSELAKNIRQFVILDARDRGKYAQEHVPNARWVDHATWAKSFQDGKVGEGWTKRIAGLESTTIPRS